MPPHWNYLDFGYGDPCYVADIITQDLSPFKPTKEGEDFRFLDLVHLVHKLQYLGRRSNNMNNNHILALIERKIDSIDRKVWLRI